VHDRLTARGYHISSLILFRIRGEKSSAPAALSDRNLSSYFF